MRKNNYTPTPSWPLALRAPQQKDENVRKRILFSITSIIFLAVLVVVTIWSFHILPAYMNNPIENYPNSQKLWNWINHNQVFVGSCSLSALFISVFANCLILDKTIEVWTRYRQKRNLE